MKKKKNMKSRIKRVVAMSILLSVLSFATILSFSAARAEREEGYLLASMLSNIAAEHLFSQETLDSFEIRDFSRAKDLSPEQTLLINRLSAFESKVIKSYRDPENPGKALLIPEYIGTESISDHKSLQYSELTRGPFAIGQIAQIRVCIDNQEIYRSEHWGTSIYRRSFVGRPLYPIVDLLTNFFRIEAVCHVAKSPGETLPSRSGAPFATVAIRLDPGFLVSYYLYMMFGILFSTLIAFLLSNIIAIFLSKNVSLPFTILDSKLRSLAREDYETTLHSQIIVKKKPLYEIKSIAGSTNTIIQKMQQFNTMQLEQKTLLENQKYELEFQKEDLMESRQLMQEAQSQLVQSQNLASIGQLTAAISHEIEQPLYQIAGNIDRQEELVKLLTKSPLRDNPENLSLINQLNDAGKLNKTAYERIASIIKSLRNFSRLDIHEMEEIDINESIQSVVLLTSNLWKRRIKMIEEYQPIPSIPCYPGLINQVFMNIVVNAIHAICEKGEISIRTWHDGDFAFIAIRDNGTGIKEEVLPHIFESGFTTKECGRGSGLGLAISKSIIEKHNGKIDVFSKPGEGSAFQITLPFHR